MPTTTTVTTTSPEQSRKLCVVFVHGWSVSNTDTYGALPERLRAHAQAAGLTLKLQDIFLGRYISFHDEVRLSDIAQAFEAAVRDQMAAVLADGSRFICITHSTGGPVVRDWWHRYYQNMPKAGICPMSHLIMLAPANYGSALAQLGKQRIGRLKAWMGGAEPGQGVLDWLELGSAEAWDLNADWITAGDQHISETGVFPFVLTGQSIDRAFYDNLNTYTGEAGSDGVVRTAAAHLQGTYLGLVQEAASADPATPGKYLAQRLEVGKYQQGPETALLVLAGKSHSGEKMGIMRSVTAELDDRASLATLEALLACIKLNSTAEYRALCAAFASATAAVQKREVLEVEKHYLVADTHFFHDKYSMLIFRVRDDEGHPISDFDLILTAGPDADPNHLPKGFFVDRQRNLRNPEIITYYFNRDVMKGCEEVRDAEGQLVRPALPGAGMLGFQIIARPDQGFVHYLPCEIKASPEMLESALHRNSTTLVDIRLRRIINKSVFETGPVLKGGKSVDFSEVKPGPGIVSK
ncbi:esterase/lipase family protein [Undibacterium parvum]|uniref:Phospholipase n=1 Tax=Undibacterium parvum TaxID=401471 RepID=A0A3S9HHU0_9BURK|nr:phospholipase [Undibacterium parvum]AZP11638.1 phospholipase [Undibacterium parvum]